MVTNPSRAGIWEDPGSLLTSQPRREVSSRFCKRPVFQKKLEDDERIQLELTSDLCVHMHRGMNPIPTPSPSPSPSHTVALLAS